MSELPPEKLKQVLKYIDENLSDKVSLSALASYAEISPYHFSHLFKGLMGISPYQYGLQQRVERAKQLLQETDLSITEIALECGFVNQAYLAKRFRTLVGMSPTRYRKLYSNPQ